MTLCNYTITQITFFFPPVKLEHSILTKGTSKKLHIC